MVYDSEPGESIKDKIKLFVWDLLCVCVGGGGGGMFMWFMRTQICIMTWV